MNIFYLDNDPKICAEYHVDKHAVKMILEYSQLLSTAHRMIDGVETVQKSKTGRNVKRWILNDYRDVVLYSATHVNHPSAVWARQSKANYTWLYNLLCACMKEYTYRYGKKHKCEDLLMALRNAPKNISDKPFTEPTPAMPDDCKVPGDSVRSYRNYYINNKTHLASWKGKVNSRNVPEWFNYALV
jgi:hypothetical protein